GDALPLLRAGRIPTLDDGVEHLPVQPGRLDQPPGIHAALGHPLAHCFHGCHVLRPPNSFQGNRPGGGKSRRQDQQPERPMTPNPDGNALRERFPTTRRWAFFDHAAVAPPSGPARDALVAWADDLAVNGGITEPNWLQRIEEVRRLAGRLLNAEPHDIAFVKNTSEGIGIVAEGFPWHHGDNLVTAAEESPANVYPWLNLAGRGVEVRRVPSRGSRVALDDVRAAIDGRTRILSLSFVEYASGFRNDLDALGEMCRQRGVYFFVDAIH